MHFISNFMMKKDKYSILIMRHGVVSVYLFVINCGAGRCFIVYLQPEFKVRHEGGLFIYSPQKFRQGSGHRFNDS